MTSGALLSSERQDWQTPPWFLDLVRAVSETGEIALDPCTSASNPTRARRWFAPDAPVGSFGGPIVFGCWGTDGLAAEWRDIPHRGLTFVNPPYGAHLSGPVSPGYEIKRHGEVIGIGRGWGAKIAAHRGEAIAIIPARTDAVWWRKVYAWCDVALFYGSEEHGARIAFVDPKTGKPAKSSNVASFIAYRASDSRDRRAAGSDRFREVFGAYGTLVPGGAR